VEANDNANKGNIKRILKELKELEGNDKIKNIKIYP